MAYGIYQYDSFLAVGRTPWAGFGTALPADEVVAPLEGMRRAGLDWEVEKRNVYLADHSLIPDAFAVVRTDLGMSLGVVGRNYECFQNAELFGFMENFCERAETSLETLGSLRNGRTVWALSRPVETEYVPNDPVKKHFLIKTCHDGSGAVEILFTDVRVVCNNSLIVALKNARSKVSVSHTPNMRLNVGAVDKVLAEYVKHQKSLGEAMSLLAARQMNADDMEALARTLTRGRSAADGEEAPVSRRGVESIMRLVEVGKGADIPGVRGTAYGFLNAVTEYADHYRIVRSGDRGQLEAGFETKLMGGGARLKQEAFDLCLKLAA
ncbi:MAG: DUF932 domain-containing protein [Deltaproteobacteria bacterium]|jgi:phage/plasmid-like protein (TIGR03299 family)|nr:DUF932 domain-containing protein [Deltaproteobacteria bacterium]